MGYATCDYCGQEIKPEDHTVKLTVGVVDEGNVWRYIGAYIPRYIHYCCFEFMAQFTNLEGW